MHLSVTEYPSKIAGERWFIGSCRDITLQKQQEDMLKHGLKMDALGKLTSGISHDYNNMLGVILGYSELLAERLKDQPELLNFVTQIQHAGERGKELTQKLLSFSRKQPASEETLIINDVLRDNYIMLAKTLTVSIKLDLELGEDLWPVYINKSSLEDAVFNISINAMHAMPEGGSLKFKTSNAKIGTLDSQVLNIKKGNYIKLSICDTGIGMNKEVMSQIFEPFFTTKNEKKGTGLGLSQVYGFVNNARGTIRVYSEPSQGTCFSLYFPRQSDQAKELDVSQQEQSSERMRYAGSENILIVDDEAALRLLHKEILSSHGYTVYCAEDAKQALSILEKENIDLVLSDVIMPEMDGYELAHLLRYKYPHIKIQLCSGFSENRGKTVTDKKLYKNILHKPFTSSELLQRVKSLLTE
jgi:nitrogen-specific signal transduction histidine kinase